MLSEGERRFIENKEKLDGEPVSDEYAAVLYSRIKRKIKEMRYDIALLAEDEKLRPVLESLAYLVTQALGGKLPTSDKHNVVPRDPADEAELERELFGECEGPDLPPEFQELVE